MDLRDLGTVERNQVQQAPTRTFFFDCESHLITQEDRIPPLVCMQYAFDDDEPVILGGTEAEIARIRPMFLALLDDPSVMFATHGGFYDICQMLDLNQYKDPEFKAPDELILKVLDACLAGRVRDTTIMAKLNAIEFDWLDFDRKMRDRPKFNLAYLTKRFTGQEVKGKSGPDVWRLRYKELHGLHPDLWPEAAREYALMDVVHLRNTFRELDKNQYPDEAFQTAAGWCLYLMGLWGIHTDPERVEAWSSYVEPKVARVVKVLIEKGLMKPGARSLNTIKRGEAVDEVCKARGEVPKLTATGKIAQDVKYLRSLGVPILLEREPWLEDHPPSKNMSVIQTRVRGWYESRGLVVPMTEGTFNDDGTVKSPPEVSTARDVFEATDDPDLLMLAEIGEFETLISTFLPAFKRSRVLHPMWNPIVATGRVSVSAGPDEAGVNLNNIPTMQGVRECFVARPGYVYWDGDYDQAELCSLSQECIDKFGYSRMAEVIRSGKDIHSVVGVTLVHEFGQGHLFDPAEDEYAQFKRQGKKGGKFYQWRQLAKAFNFGLPGGLGKDTFIEWARKQYQVNMPPERFKPAKEAWLEVVPEVRDLFAWVGQRTRESYNDRFTFTQHRSGRRRGGCNYTVGCNTGFQGLTSDGAKNALIMIFRECHTVGSALYGCRLVAQIYDEFLVEVPRDRIDVAHPRLLELMKLGMEEYTPDVPARASAEVMKHWSKTAKLAVVKGKIIPSDEIMIGVWSGLARFLGWVHG